MLLRKSIYGCLLLALVCQASSMAQQASESYQLPPVDYHPIAPWPPAMGESYHHDSTALGNILRGSSHMMHATGNYWLNRSQAAILFEYARSLENCNRRQWVELHAWNRQRLNAQREQRLTAKRVKNVASRPAKYQAAYRLTDEQLDRKTGWITWPTVLQAAEYAELRSRLDTMFRQLAGNFANVDESPERIATCAKCLERGLQRNIKTVERSDYIAAQKFLCGLKYEPEFSKPHDFANTVSIDEPRALNVN